jgi:hypothetical protein
MPENIEWFRSILEEEISSSKSFFLNDISKSKTDKGIKRLKKVYSSDQVSNLIDISQLDECNIQKISNLMELYASEVMRYFLKRLCEGEVTKTGLRQKFEVNIMSENFELIENLISEDSEGLFGELFESWLINRFL